VLIDGSESTPVFLTAFAIVRERERGTLEQLLVTPVSKGGLIVGKLLPYTVIGFSQTVLVLLVMIILFQVPVSGLIALLLCLSFLFLDHLLCEWVILTRFWIGSSMQVRIFRRKYSSSRRP
jgi:ABC-type Na+ efflux pump permease subunit